MKLQVWSLWIKRVLSVLSGARYYKNIKELPLSRFIEIIDTGDIKPIVKRGIGDERMMAKYWDDIFNEYIQITKDKKFNATFLTLRFIAFEKNRIFLIIHILKSLSIMWNPKLAESLNRLGIRRKFSEKTIHQDIKIAYNETKGILAAIKHREQELKQNDDQDQTNKGAEWMRLIIDISKFQGYRLDPNEITVYEFCLTMVNYKEANNEIKKKINHANRDNY